MRRRTGWWANHEYTRRSVGKNSKGFVGWNELLTTMMRINGRTAEKYRSVFVAAFETGGRLGEILKLNRKMFIVDKEKRIVRVVGMPLEKVKGNKNATRKDFCFDFDGVLTPLLINLLERIGPDGTDAPLFPNVGGQRVYEKFTEAGIFPHWVRSQRAHQLRKEFKFSPVELMRFFSWRKTETAILYSEMNADDLEELFLERRKEAEEKMREALRVGAL
jgi:integrase